MTYKVLIFDFFGVIINDIYSIWLHNHMLDELKIKAKTRFDTPTYWIDITEKKLFTELGALSGQSQEEICKEWDELVNLNWQVVELIAELKKEYKVVLLSNSPGSLVRKYIQKYQIEDIFDTIIISSEVGSQKPDKGIYEITMKRVGYLPRESIIVDDSIANIRGAEELGIQGILYKNVSSLVIELMNFNIHN